jgi:ribonucleoside-diphosphate reductase alpha chain
MEKEIFVIKRDGSKEEFSVEKINKVLGWAINGQTGVNLSDLEINTKLNIRDGITTKEIHKVLIETAANLISLESPNYQYVAARLINYGLRKEVWGGKIPPRLLDSLKDGINKGYYDDSILKKYTKQEINKIGEMVDHDRDFLFTYAGIKQLCDKYLIQNRKTKEIYETPNLAYILLAMYLFQNYEGEKRMTYVKRAYNFFSKHKINLATPVMAGVRGMVKSYASCMLIDMDDTKESINATNTAISMATASRYGIGVNVGRMRSIGTEIRGGETVHPGVIPFLKIIEGNVKAWQQASLRGGSATTTFPIWHLQIEDIIQLKDVGGTNDNRVFNLDYSISISKLFYERFIKNENLTLFSPHEVKDLYEAYGLDHFDEMYLKLERDETIKYKKVISARDLFLNLTKQRLETGRIYILNIDNANRHVSWNPEECKSLKMSNLCQEVIMPTIPLIG